MPPAKSPQAAPVKGCAMCFRPEDQIGECGFGSLCPREATSYAPDKAVTLTCGPCQKTRVVPVQAITAGKLSKLDPCRLQLCAAVVVIPATPRPLGAPPPLKG